MKIIGSRTVTFVTPPVAILPHYNFYLSAVVYVFIEERACLNLRTWKTQSPSQLNLPALAFIAAPLSACASCPRLPDPA